MKKTIVVQQNHPWQSESGAHLGAGETAVVDDSPYIYREAANGNIAVFDYTESEKTETVPEPKKLGRPPITKIEENV